jgi:hypothetical protein
MSTAWPVEESPNPPWWAWLEDERCQRRVLLAQGVTQEELEDVLKLAGQHPRLDKTVGIYEGLERRGAWGAGPLNRRRPYSRGWSLWGPAGVPSVNVLSTRR